MRHLAYAAMLVAVLVCTLPLVWAYRLRLFARWRRLLAAILPAAAVFVAWDVAATHAGHWAFDPAQVLPPRVLGLPLEELGFFLVVPLAGLITYEAVGTVLRDGLVPRRWAPAVSSEEHTSELQSH